MHLHQTLSKHHHHHHHHHHLIIIIIIIIISSSTTFENFFPPPKKNKTPSNSIGPWIHLKKKTWASQRQQLLMIVGTFVVLCNQISIGLLQRGKRLREVVW